MRAEHRQLLWTAVTSHVYALRLQLMSPTVALPGGVTRSATRPHREGAVTGRSTRPDCALWLIKPAAGLGCPPRLDDAQIGVVSVLENP